MGFEVRSNFGKISKSLVTWLMPEISGLAMIVCIVHGDGEEQQAMRLVIENVDGGSIENERKEGKKYRE